MTPDIERSMKSRLRLRILRLKNDKLEDIISKDWRSLIFREFGKSEREKNSCFRSNRSHFQSKS
jgi:hypothetical protein